MSFPLKINNLLLKSTKIIICLVPLLPLYIASSVMFPFVTGKNFAFRVLVEFAAVFWLGLMSASKEYRPRNSIMVLSVLAFTFIVGLADLFGINPYNSFWSNYERMAGYITILHLALYFMIVKSVFRTRKDWIIFFSICVAASMFSSLFTFIEPFSFEKTGDYINEYGTRIGGTIGNPPFLASYLLLSVFVGIILMQTVQKKYLKLFLLFTVVINSVVIYITASRGAILGAFAGAVMIGAFLLLKKLRDRDAISLKKVLFYISGLLIGLSIIVFAVFNLDFMENNRTVSRFMMISLDDPSVKTRFYAWKMMWNAFKENPVLGWGQENFFGIYTVNLDIREGLKPLDRAHNIVLDWMFNAGLLGLLSYLAMFGAAFYILRDALRKEIVSGNGVLIIAAAFIVYFIQNLFTFDTISTYIVFFALLAYIDNIESINKDPYDNFEGNMILKKSGMIPAVVTLLALLVISSASYFINFIPFKQLRAFTRIVMSPPQHDYLKVLDDFNKALSYRSFGDSYIRDAMQSMSYQIVSDQLYHKQGARELISRTIEELEKGLAANRYDLEYIKGAIYFYRLLAMHQPSFVTAVERLIEECMRINPRYQGLEIAKIDVLILKKDFEKAFHRAKRLSELRPENYLAQFTLALTAILTSREKIKDEALENARKIRDKGEKNIADEKKPVLALKQVYILAQAYMEVKNYNAALQYYRKILDMIPEAKAYKPLNAKDKRIFQAGFYFEIAKAYAYLGDRENAEKAAEKVMELAPEIFRGKIEKLMEEPID